VEKPNPTGSSGSRVEILFDQTEEGVQWGEKPVSNSLFLGLALVVIIAAILAWPTYVVARKCCGKSSSGVQRERVS
jgi:hypothetical protein